MKMVNKYFEFINFRILWREKCQVIFVNIFETIEELETIKRPGDQKTFDDLDTNEEVELTMYQFYVFKFLTFVSEWHPLVLEMLSHLKMTDKAACHKLITIEHI